MSTPTLVISPVLQCAVEWASPVICIVNSYHCLNSWTDVDYKSIVERGDQQVLSMITAQGGRGESEAGDTLGMQSRLVTG